MSLVEKSALPLAPPLAASGADGRILALDGVRGLMTILVVVSHFFAEIPGGHSVFGFGWIAVNMFFVLSGFLIGRLIMDKMDRANFFTVFFVRRFCRTVPSYLLCVLIIFATLYAFRDRPWANWQGEFPIWSYFAFSQNLFMAATNQVGVYWLSPTWTLALEEQFYLLAPLAFFLLATRRWLAFFIAVALFAVVARAVLLASGPGYAMASLVLLPTRADVLVMGVIAAILMRSPAIDWRRHLLALRAAPIAALVVASILTLVDNESRYLFNVFGPFLISAGCAAFLMALTLGAPEAERFHSPTLRFFGHTSYCIYLVHLLVAGLMHGLILGQKPGLFSLEQWLVTIAALPLTVLAGWLLTKYFEERLTNYGRTWKWSAAARA